MPTSCEHCGTPFSPSGDGERFCCTGCECVAAMIREGGYGRFYDLRGSAALAPVKGRPFENPDFDWLQKAVGQAEADAAEKRAPATLDCSLEGLSCVACVWLVERLFERRDGALRAVSNPARGSLHLEWEPGVCDVPDFARELVSFGYTPAPPGPEPDRETSSLGARAGLCFAFALNAMGFTLPFYLGMGEDFAFADLFRLIAFLTATLAMLVGGSWFISRAWRSLRAGMVHIDLPISLGLVAAYLGSIAGWIAHVPGLLYFDFVCNFVFLMLGGRWVQTLAVEKNRRRMARRSPLNSAVPRPGGGEALPLARIQPGDTFLLEPGRALPVAATLLDPMAEISLEWIRGESAAIPAGAGSNLSAGTILLGRTPVEVRALETWQDSLLARLTAGTESTRYSPFLDKLLRVYLAVVVLLGIAGFLAWLPVAGVGTALQIMISVFVVSCPCALGVAIPFADERAARLAARLGVFVRNATLWSRLRSVRKIVFDKTGTLTLERPILETPEVLAQLDDEAATALALLTSGSCHPTARALIETLGSRGQTLLSRAFDPVDSPPVHEEPGMGVRARIGGHEWALGRPAWIGLDESPATVLARDGAAVAAFAFRDAVRPDAKAAVSERLRAGLEVHILSGDHPEKVARFADALGIDSARAHGGLTPDEKADRLARIGQRDTLYLGDGANDSLAFDHAWVTGTPVAERSLLEKKADFFTLGDSLRWLPELFAIARTRTLGIRTAFAFALAYNLATVAVSLSGHMDPLLAAILMPLSSVASLALVSAPKVANPPAFSHAAPENRPSRWQPPEKSPTACTNAS